jgi:hypothetical protein
MAPLPVTPVFGRPWSEDDDRTLRNLFAQGFADKAAGTILDRSEASVMRRRQRLGLFAGSDRARTVKRAYEARLGVQEWSRQVRAIVTVRDIAAHYAGRRYDDCPKARRDAHNQMPRRSADVVSGCSSAMAW